MTISGDIIAEYNVAMRNRLKVLNEAEAPLRAIFETARKPHQTSYQVDCKELQAIRDQRLAAENE